MSDENYLPVEPRRILSKPPAIPAREHPAVLGLSAPARELFLAIGDMPAVTVYRDDLMVSPPGDFPGVVPEADRKSAELDSMLGELARENLIVRWEHRDRPAVTLSPLAAEILHVRLDRHATHWVDRKTREPKVRMKRRKLESGQEVITEVDLAIDPPGQLDQQADPRAVDPSESYAESDELIREAERSGGYLRPLFLVGGDMAWPVDGQQRGPAAPDAGPVPDGQSPIGVDATGPCGGCGGSVAKYTLCLGCDSYYGDSLLPKAARITAKAAMDRAGKAERAEVARHMKDLKRMREGGK